MRRALALILFLIPVVLAGHAQTPSPRTALHGRVFAADTGAELRHARIQAITTNEAVPPTFTGTDGRFAFSAAVNRSSRLSITKPGFLPTTIAATRPDVDVEVRMLKAGAISGRITDTLGDGVIGMTVTAEISAASEVERKVVATCDTDDRGEYRLAGLPAGRFFVSVNARAAVIGSNGTLLDEESVASLRNGRRVTEEMSRQMRMRVYYPGVQTGVGDALPVALGAGEERPTMDFSVPALKPVDLFGGVGSRVVPRFVSRPGPISLTPAMVGTGVIRGRVVAADGRVLAGAIVHLESDGDDNFEEQVPAAITDAEGRYEFQRLGTRTFTVVATRAGFITTAYRRGPPSEGAEPIVLRTGEVRDNTDIALPRPGAVAGRVVDDEGEPVEGARVQAQHIEYRDGRRGLTNAGTPGGHRTDDRGAYRIYGLPPGEYILSADVGHIVSGRQGAYLPGFATSYAPATASPGEARKIAVDLAQEVLGVEVTLVRAPTVRISGTIVDAAGKGLDETPILTPSRRSGVIAGDPLSARMDTGGRFEFANVTPGEYIVQASKGGSHPSDEGESVSQFVAVGNADITGLTLRLSRGSTVKGHITFDGQSSPESYFALNLQAVPVDADRTPQNLETPASARIQQDGTFDMAGLSGPRAVRLTEAAADWTLKAVLLNGRDITDSPLPLGTANQSIDGLEVVLTDRVSEVTGRVLDARGRGVANATTIVFSTDRGLWGEASRWGETSRFVGSVRTGKDGAFSVRHLPPGYYYAAAVTQLAPGEWRNPDLIESLVPSATPVTILEGDTTTATLIAVLR